MTTLKSSRLRLLGLAIRWGHISLMIRVTLPPSLVAGYRSVGVEESVIDSIPLHARIFGFGSLFKRFSLVAIVLTAALFDVHDLKLNPPDFINDRALVKNDTAPSWSWALDTKSST